MAGTSQGATVQMQTNLNVHQPLPTNTVALIVDTVLADTDMQNEMLQQAAGNSRFVNYKA